jgi:acyl-coenzyme A thioesterase PaaI-like protein
MENDPDNPCFGCGPNNQYGLNLKFFRTGDKTVSAEKTFDKRFSAWPGQVHGGIVFAALECTCQWAFYSVKGQVGPTERFAINFPSRVLIDEPAKLIGSALKENDEIVCVRAELIQQEQVRAWMEQDIRIVYSREEFMRLRPAVNVDSIMARNLPV